MNCTRLTWHILWCTGIVHILVEAIVVSRQTRDQFSNPNQGNCVDDKKYCSERKATCFGGNCCTCKCRKSYSTFHSPGLSYYLENGTASYRFDKKESCAWNHYSHEGCRFIQEHRSNSSNPFLPLINLDKNDTLHLKARLNGIFQCKRYQLFSKKPLEHAWVNFEGKNIFETLWNETESIQLTLKWSSQGLKYGGLLLKLNFSCDLTRKGRPPELCMILKIRGSYNTQTNSSEFPTKTPIVDGQQKLESKSTAKVTLTPTSFVSGKPKSTAEATLSPTSSVDRKTTQKPTSTMNKTGNSGATSNSNTKTEHSHGDTFWILVIVFVAFAFFEVICVILFLLYRRRKQKQRSKNLPHEIPRNYPFPNYENYGMTVSSESCTSLHPYPANVQLYENDENDEPRHIYARMGTFRRERDLASLEDASLRNKSLSECSSKRSSRILKSGSIIVLPRDCVLVHATESRKSRCSEQDEESIANPDGSIAKIKDGASLSRNSNDSRSLFSWGSFSSFYETSTDEDYVSGGNAIECENDSFYEEPDKVFSKDQKDQKPPLPPKNVGLEGLFSLQESVISATVDDNEHIYETAENVLSHEDYKSFKDKNAYDLPEDAVSEGQVKSNKSSLKRALDVDKPAEDISEQSLNLGSSFSNDDETNEDSEDIKLRPKPKSTLFLREMFETLEDGTSVC